jgi:secreted trypsin-like serine protease
VALAAAGLMATALSAAPSAAVVHGTPVAHPERTVPWVVTVYQGADSASVGREDLICTGAALDRWTVLTAAHCAESLGDDVLVVGFGGATLRSQERVAVSAFQAHPQYDPWEVVHDVAVLRTAAPLDIAAFPRLPNRRQAARAHSASTRFTIYGWGDVDRAGVVTGHLNRARLTTRTRRAKQVWGSEFNARRQLAAGAIRARARNYPGACAGDSGGPLVMTSRGRPVVVGVTSYGEKRCGAHSPTIFTAVDHYASWIRSTAAALDAADQAGADAVPDPTGPGSLPADPDLVIGLP